MRTAGLIAFVLAQLASLAAATHFIAASFRYQPALGAPISRAGDVALYWPWSVLDWSQSWRAHYPRQFALADAILFSGFLGGVFAAIALARADAPKLRRHGKNGWASFAEIARANLFARSGAILGKLDGEILAYEGAGHMLLIGASRSGKGRGHVVPTLLAWPHSALVLDVKGELAFGDARHAFPGTAGFRARLGPALCFSPTRPGSARFNPLFEVRRGPNEVRDAQNVVEIVVDPNGDGRAEDFWDRSAKQILVGLILHVLYAEPEGRKTLAVVREKLRDLDRQAGIMAATLHRVSPETGLPEIHPEVLHAALSYLAGEDRMRTGIKATAESFFGVFADPLVAANTAASDFRVGDLMCHERPVTLYLQPPPSDAPRLMPLMRLVLNQITRALMEEQGRDATGRDKRHDLLLVLDEFPQLGRLGFFESAMGAFAGYGLKAYLVCQSLNHVTRAYGRDSVILDNCSVITAFAAADMETAKAIAAMTGERYEMVESQSITRPRPLIGAGRGSISFREERRPLMLAGDVRQLPADEQLIFVAGLKPIRAKKLRFDAEKIFRARLLPPAAPAPQLSTAHDWIGVRPIGRLPQRAAAHAKATIAGRAVARPRAAPGVLSATRADEQGELFSDAEAQAPKPSQGTRISRATGL